MKKKTQSADGDSRPSSGLEPADFEQFFFGYTRSAGSIDLAVRARKPDGMSVFLLILIAAY